VPYHHQPLKVTKISKKRLKMHYNSNEINCVPNGQSRPSPCETWWWSAMTSGSYASSSDKGQRNLYLHPTQLMVVGTRTPKMKKWQEHWKRHLEERPYIWMQMEEVAALIKKKIIWNKLKRIIRWVFYGTGSTAAANILTVDLSSDDENESAIKIT
jgi:hypothetical protein